MKRAAWTLLLAVVIVSFAAGPVASDPIRIDGGSYELALNVRWTTFSISANWGTPDVLLVAGRSYELDRGFVPPVLQIGQEIDLSHTFNQTFTWREQALYPYALVAGTEYPEVIFTASNFRFVAEPATVGPGIYGAAVETTFTFSGTVNGFSVSGDPLFSQPIAGRGFAHLAAAPGPDGLTPYAIVYGFRAGEPIPEPATVILVGGGMLVMAAGRFRRRGTGAGGKHSRSAS